MLKVIDLAGRPIRVNNLEAAIKQADLYRNQYHEDPRFAELDKRLRGYWEDLYQKLVALR
ncbi:hypothetical protein FFJ24_012065 [Pedobacter sp. KBS0701]|uniref:hypothetical protein n=1 Tax=Pedobacter sp. KBS0701 TaxID=2578106 RepID=UPI00110DC489|nr:hypothetical protein [Pedobacter sp. KBS0701]QDW25511.1 hypothetical protein FFJ24_012065 [Pedobacter sp. KBS0701]